MENKRDEYVASVIITTKNTRIMNIAEAMFDTRIPLELGIEFLEYWDALSDKAGEWNTGNTVYMYDQTVEISIYNIYTEYQTFIKYNLPDVQSDKIEKLEDGMNKITEAIEQFKDGLITTNEMIALIEKQTV